MMAPSANDHTSTQVETFKDNGLVDRNAENSHPLSTTILTPFPNINQSLPALSALASVASTSSPRLRLLDNTSKNNATHHMNYTNSSPGATTGGPFCQNCKTQTTPLWRRDEIGSVLCNACGLFLKLHKTARPISLKTDVIKSRNRVKTAQAQRKRSHFEANGEMGSRSEAGTPPPGQEADRHGSRKTSSGASDRSITPASRTDTPSVNHPSNIAPQHLFDGIAGAEHSYRHSSSVPTPNMRQPSSGSISSLNERHADASTTTDELRQARTRISELEFVNDLFKGRVDQLEADTHRAEIFQRESDTQLRFVYEQSQARENALKREIEDLKREIAELKEKQPPSKRPRLSDDFPTAVRPQQLSA